MREWLRGGVQPCQGWGRGFESRLALIKSTVSAVLFCSFKSFSVFFCGYSSVQISHTEMQEVTPLVFQNVASALVWLILVRVE